MRLFNRIIAVAAGIMALSSCVEEALSPLTGKYPKPETYEMNTLVAQSVEKGEKTRTFTVEVSGEKASMTLKFVGDKYYLADESYTASPEAKKGTYLVGNGGTTITIGGNTIAVESGTIVVKQENGTYNMSGTIWLADESAVKILSSVALVYEADPEPVKLSTVLSAASNLANGVSTISMSLAQDGISSEMDMSTYQTIWHGEGNYLSIDLYSADGYLHEGTYTANTVGGEVSEGQFGIGYDTTVDWGFGPMEMKDWGTCWWTVGNGVATAQKVLEGTMTVTKKGSKWVIELISGEGKEMIWAKFEGAVDALTDGGNAGGSQDDTDYIELTNLLSATKNQGLLSINMAQDGISSTTDPNTWQTTWEGEGNYLAADIYSADGKLYTGEYKACAVGGTVGEGEFGIGYDTEFWGMQMYDWGTCWWTVADGATSAEKILDGTMTVAMEGDNVVIKLKSSVVNAKFTYPVSGLIAADGSAVEVVDLGGNEGTEPAPDYTEFTELLIVQPNQGYDESGQPTGEYTSFTLKVGTDGTYTEVVNNGWYDETKIKGNGQVLSIDFYTEDGTLAAGTYEACAEGGVVGEGEFGIGYDVEMWGMQMVWGTCVTPYENDAEGAIQKITDGTITVEVSGDVYTITLESSAVNARYIGTLTL